MRHLLATVAIVAATTSIVAPATIVLAAVNSLDIVKGVASVSNPNVAFVPGVRNPTGMTWSGTGAVAPGFSGIATTAALAGGAPNANVTKADADDIVRFAIVVENTGTNINGAFDVAINDSFPDGFVVPAGGIDLLVVNGAGTALASTASGAFVAGGGTAGPVSGTITLTDGASGSLAAGSTGGVVNSTGTNVAVITYELQVAGAAVPGTVHTNTSNLTGFSDSEGGANFIGLVPAVNATNTATVTMAPVGIVNTLQSTDQTSTALDTVAIGEVVTYEIVLAVPEGTTSAVNLVDTLDAGQAMVAVDSIAATAPLTTSIAGGFPAVLANAQTPTGVPGRMSLAFGSVVNSNRVDTVAETITVVYRAIVLNVSTNTIDLAKNNSATVTFTGAVSGATASAAVRISEPVLITGKSSNPTTATAAETITFVVNVSHTGQVSDTDAFNVTTVDVVPAGLIYVADSLRPIGELVTAPSTLEITGATITATWDRLSLSSLQYGQFSYDARVDPAAATPASVVNTATTTWMSLPGAPLTTTDLSTNDTQRTGADAAAGRPGVNDYLSLRSATVSVPLVLPDPQIVNSLYATDDASTIGTNMTIGETGTYQLRITLPEGTIPGFQVRDVLPAGLRLMAGVTIYTTAALSNGQLAADFAGTLGTVTTSTASNAVDAATVDVGASVVNQDSNPANNSILIRFDAIVADVAGNVGLGTSTALANAATVQLSGGTLVASNVVTADVVEPHLAVAKSFSAARATPGSTVATTITLGNDGSSNGYDTVLTDVLDAGFAAASVVSTQVPSGWTFGRVGSTLTWTANNGTTQIPGDTVIFRFTAVLPASSLDGGRVPNSASAITTSRSARPVGERTSAPVSGSTILDVVTPDLQVSKTDGVLSAVPGDALHYVIVITNVGQATATNVTLTDTLAPGTTFAGVTGPCSMDVAGSTPTVKKFGLGSVATDATVSCTVSVSVDDPAPAGLDAIVNTVAVVDDHANGSDPTPGNNLAQDSDILAAAPELAVSKTDGRAKVRPGDTVTYTIVVTNAGNQDATGVVTTDVLPAGTTFVSATGLPAVVDGTATWFATRISGGTSVSYSVTVHVDLPYTATLLELRNVATVVDDHANGLDPAAGNNSGADTDIVDNSLDLGIVNSNGTDISTPGTASTWQLTITNNGPVPVSRFAVTEFFPAQLSTITLGSSAGSYDAASQVWAGPAVPVGGHVTIAVSGLIAANAAGALTNAATVSPLDGFVDPAPADNTAVDVDSFVIPELTPVEVTPLPLTGSDVTGLVTAASALVLCGTLLARRRRRVV